MNGRIKNASAVKCESNTQLSQPFFLVRFLCSPCSSVLKVLVLACCTVLLLGAQTQAPESARELEAGKQAALRSDYANAVTHLTKANQLQDEKCSECYVWLARIEMAQGNLPHASAEIEKALATAATGLQQANAQLYHGVVLRRQGNLAQAEAAFRAASASNPACVECKFNLGFVLLKESKDAEGVEVLKTVAPEFAGTLRGREIQRFIADPSRVRKTYAPEFSTRLKSGEEVSLDTLKGKVVLVDFWGTWCAPCRVSLPFLKDLAAKVDPAKVAIISIDEGDSKQSWEQFIQDNGMQWSQVYDGDLSMYRAFGVDGFPRYFVLSKDGIILEEFKGWDQNGAFTISDAIARALKR
jgi:thiol-disulfide isomerase/thioredoxin